MSDKIRVALVGCGGRGIGMSNYFVKHPDSEVTALMDIFPSATAAAAESLGIPDAQIFDNFDKLLEDGSIDAVFIAADPMVQTELACRAMEAGKHACTEVPACFTIDDCWKLVKTVRKTGRQYQMMEQARFWGFIETWTQMHERGEFGHICFAQGEYVHYAKHWNSWINKDTGEMCSAFRLPDEWNAEPSWRYKLLSDPIYYLPHTLSPLLKVLDDRVTRVSCMGTRKKSYSFPDEEIELPWSDIQYALMHTEKDTVMVVGAGFSFPHVPRGQTTCHWYDVRGTKASVESPRGRDDQFRVWRVGADTYETMDLSTVPLRASEEDAKSGHGGADSRTVATFLEAIRTGEPPEMDVYRAAETAAPAILAAESARHGGIMVTVPDFRTNNIPESSQREP